MGGRFKNDVKYIGEMGKWGNGSNGVKGVYRLLQFYASTKRWELFKTECDVKHILSILFLSYSMLGILCIYVLCILCNTVFSVIVDIL